MFHHNVDRNHVNLLKFFRKYRKRELNVTVTLQIRGVSMKKNREIYIYRIMSSSFAKGQFYQEDLIQNMRECVEAPLLLIVEYVLKSIFIDDIY